MPWASSHEVGEVVVAQWKILYSISRHKSCKATKMILNEIVQMFLLLCMNFPLNGSYHVASGWLKCSPVWKLVCSGVVQGQYNERGTDGTTSNVGLRSATRLFCYCQHVHTADRFHLSWSGLPLTCLNYCSPCWTQHKIWCHRGSLFRCR